MSFSTYTEEALSPVPVYHVSEQGEPLLRAVDGLPQGPALEPVVRFVMGLRQQAAAVA